MDGPIIGFLVTFLKSTFEFYPFLYSCGALTTSYMDILLTIKALHAFQSSEQIVSLKSRETKETHFLSVSMSWSFSILQDPFFYFFIGIFITNSLSLTLSLPPSLSLYVSLPPFLPSDPLPLNPSCFLSSLSHFVHSHFKQACVTVGPIACSCGPQWPF